MSGFDEQWRSDKVLVCSLRRGQVLTWGWFSSGRGEATVTGAVDHARFIRRETSGEPVWIEHYGRPAILPEQARRFNKHGVKE